MRTLPRSAQRFQYAEMICSGHFFANADATLAPRLLDQAIVAAKLAAFVCAAKCDEFAARRRKISGAAAADLRLC